MTLPTDDRIEPGTYLDEGDGRPISGMPSWPRYRRHDQGDHGLIEGNRLFHPSREASDHERVVNQRSIGGRLMRVPDSPCRHPRGGRRSCSSEGAQQRVGLPAAATLPRATLAAPRRAPRPAPPATRPEPAARPPRRPGRSDHQRVRAPHRRARSSRPSGSRSSRGPPEQRQPVRLRMGEHAVRHGDRGPDGLDLRRLPVADGQQRGVQQAGVRHRRRGLQGSRRPSRDPDHQAKGYQVVLAIIDFQATQEAIDAAGTLAMAEAVLTRLRPRR